MGIAVKIDPQDLEAAVEELRQIVQLECSPAVASEGRFMLDDVETDLLAIVRGETSADKVARQQSDGWLKDLYDECPAARREFDRRVGQAFADLDGVKVRDA